MVSIDDLLATSDTLGSDKQGLEAEKGKLHGRTKEWEAHLAKLKEAVKNGEITGSTETDYLLGNISPSCFDFRETLEQSREKLRAFLTDVRTSKSYWIKTHEYRPTRQESYTIAFLHDEPIILTPQTLVLKAKRIIKFNCERLFGENSDDGVAWSFTEEVGEGEMKIGEYDWGHAPLNDRSHRFDCLVSSGSLQPANVQVALLRAINRDVPAELAVKEKESNRED